MRKRLLIFYLILFATNASAFYVVKDTCYSKIDSVSIRSLKICVKKKSSMSHHVTYSPGQFYKRVIELTVESELVVHKKKKYINVYSNNKIIYESYLETKLSYEVPVHEIYRDYYGKIDMSENAKNKINETTVIIKHEITKWNDDGTKETLVKIKDHLDYRHIVYDSKNQKIKTESINNNDIKWDEWGICVA